MRLFLITIFCVYCSTSIFAQYCPPLSGKIGEKKSFHITAGYGFTKMYGDISNNSALGSAGTIQVDYQLKKGLYVGVESQFGKLKTEVSSNADARQSINDYTAAGVVATIHPFELLAKRRSHLQTATDVFLNSFFVGVGTLYVINNYDQVYRNFNDLSSYGPIEGYDENDDPIFHTRTRSLVLPSLNFGINVPLIYGYSNDYMLSLVLKGQVNYAQNDVVDAYTPYDSQGVRIQGESDVYNFYSLGIRYSF